MKTNSQRDIDSIARGARMLSEILSKVITRTSIGASGIELNAYAEQLIHDAGGRPAFKGYGAPPYPSTLCVSINECVVHGVPTDYRFKAGDLVGLDIGMQLDGYYSDMARTIVLKPARDEDQQLVDCAQEALDAGIALVRPGTMTGDIGAEVQSVVEGGGYGVVRDLAGHGVGRSLHEAPEVPNFGTRGRGVILKEGMVIALEPMITVGSWKVTIGDDKWSVLTVDGSKTAHVEDMVLVTASGHMILTRS